MTTLRRRQLFGGGLLVLAALLCGAWLLRMDRAAKISTDVLDLIPAGERSPELTLVRQLASHAEARTMLLELTDGGKPASPAAVARFVATLQREPSLASVVAMDDPRLRDGVARIVHAERFSLLFPAWLEQQQKNFSTTGRPPAEFVSWLAEEAAQALTRFLGQAEALAFQDVLPSDPLLLLPSLAMEMKGGLDVVAPPTDSAAPALVWAQLAASPLSEEGQGPVFAALDRALAESRREFPRLQLAYTGINRFAAASRARIEREVKLLNALSLVAVLGIALVFLRSAWRGLHLVPAIALSMLGAWTCTTLMFDRVHVLVFVVGSLLTGVAIDYGFYLFMQPPQHAGEDYWAKVRRLLKPLLASCATTVAGFALLLFSELPLIRQLGVFVGSGLVSALLAAILYFSTVRNDFLETRTFRAGGLLSAGARRWARRGLVALWLTGLPGLAWLTWRDDIRELEIPSPELHREDARLRALFGERGDGVAYLSYGATLGEAREALRRLEAWLVSSGGNAVNLARVVPTDDAHRAALAFLRDAPDFVMKLRGALERQGFDAAEFELFFTAFAEHARDARAADLPAAVERLQAGLVGPLSLLVHRGETLSWFVTLASRPPGVTPPVEASSVAASQLQSLNHVFARYRRAAVWFSLAGLGLVGGGVLLTYGWRDGWRIFAIPCGTCLGVFGWFGWAGVPLNLFHLLGAFLGLCLMHNYSIFSATSAFRGEAPPASVRLSALTTAASFGVLALSSIPVVQALGSTVALMIVGALVIIELEHLSALGAPHA
ncbi:MAG: hypothetical protein C0518_06485 [Opitutus sp.]|nr:hypothetical protein [Opitutus sp.]